MPHRRENNGNQYIFVNYTSQKTNQRKMEVSKISKNNFDNRNTKEEKKSSIRENEKYENTWKNVKRR